MDIEEKHSGEQGFGGVELAWHICLQIRVTLIYEGGPNNREILDSKVMPWSCSTWVPTEYKI